MIVLAHCSFADELQSPWGLNQSRRREMQYQLIMEKVELR